jgi:uncharacterized membrane protein YfcA
VSWTLLPIYFAIGGGVGFLAGLLGIGGSMTMIPLLAMIFTHEGFAPEHVLHIAVATSMATIIFTSISSVRAHAQHDAVLWPVAIKLAPGILVGSLVGPQIVGLMSTAVLACVFATFATYTAIRLLWDKKPKPTRVLPGTTGLVAVGAGIGLLSSMVGAGGAFISVPFMTACNIKIQKAIGTSSALGLPIAVAGTIGFLVAGLRQTGLPSYSLGYIYFPALLVISSASVISAPIGARLAHRWPIAHLRRAFACLLLVIAAYFVRKAWTA